MSIDHTKARDVFLEAIEKHDGAERQAYLEQTCQGNTALRGEVEKLLAAHQQNNAFLDPQRAINIACRMSDMDLRQMGWAAKFNLGALLFRNGECVQTLDCLEGVLGGRELTGGTHLYQAMAHWRLNDPEEAQGFFAHGVSDFLARPAAAPYTAARDEARHLLERILEQQYQTTRQVLDRAIETEPSLQFLWIRRGAVQLKLNRFAEDLSDYMRAVELHPATVTPGPDRSRSCTHWAEMPKSDY